MPRYNQDKIAKLISELRRAVERLRALKAVDKKIFLGDPNKIGSAKYHGLARTVVERGSRSLNGADRF